MDERRPLKDKNLKVIDYINKLYATIDGSSLWEIDKSTFSVLKMCDGKRTMDQIAEEIAKKIDMKVEDVMPTLIDILREMERLKFIEYVSV
jgi:aminopeptidase-like protein